jgi:serine/threonine protein kinase
MRRRLTQIVCFVKSLPEFYAIKQIYPNTANQEQVVKNWTKELENLRAVTSLQLPHVLRFITAFRRGDSPKQDHFLLCEWADGGNLRDVWMRNKSPVLTGRLVRQTIAQLQGLADALYHIHYSEKLAQTEGIIHGDLKPENILCFKSNDEDDILGTLKIGDWGLAKEKDIKTRDQQHASIYRASIKYEPPEMSEGVLVGTNEILKTRSRLYDIWSMGCIMLELVIWLVKGTKRLSKLHEDIGSNQFWEVAKLLGKPEVRAFITRAMDELASEPACRTNSALGDVLDLIRTRLLVVRLPKNLASRDDDPERAKEGLRRSNTVDRRELSSSDDSDDPHSGKIETVSFTDTPELAGEPVDMTEERPAILITGPDQPELPSQHANDKSEPTEERGEPRARADQMLESLNDIKSTDEDYWNPKMPPAQNPSFILPQRGTTSTFPGSAESSAPSTLPSLGFSGSTWATDSTPATDVYVDSGRLSVQQKGKSSLELPKSGSLDADKQQDVREDLWR